MSKWVEMMSEDVSDQSIQSPEDVVFFLMALDKSIGGQVNAKR